MDNFDDQSFGWNDNFDPTFQEPNCEGPNFEGNFRNKRYNDAYGNYRGGYGPEGGFGGPPGYQLGFGPGPGPRPYFLRGRGYGPGGPGGPHAFMGPFGPGGPGILGGRRNSHEDKALRYLIRCGVSRDSLKLLPREYFRMIQPEYCSICSQGLQSFMISRMHYISKNHLKNKKRWLANQPKIGKGENPIRSRDLYCELCDVEITSKTHADSHYAGKPHRSVVDGRKNPKNQNLLQENMKGRLQQLIRREKKFLKPLDSASTDVVEKVAKVVSPELYCDICKTSMTCSEQMTMHMNGKRHLSREKQHILRMMKGDPDPKEPVNAPEADDDDEEKADEEPEEDDDEKADEEPEANPDGDGDEAAVKVENCPEANGGEENDGVKKEDAKDEPVAKADDDWGAGAEDW